MKLPMSSWTSLSLAVTAISPTSQCWSGAAQHVLFGRCLKEQMGVSKNRGTPKWMVKIMENLYQKWMIWGYPYFWKHPNCVLKNHGSSGTLQSETPQEALHAAGREDSRHQGLKKQRHLSRAQKPPKHHGRAMSSSKT